MTERLLTSDELAEALSVHRNTVMNWLRDGVIPAAIREGKTLRFSLPVVEKALAKRAAKRTRELQPVANIPDDMIPTY